MPPLDKPLDGRFPRLNLASLYALQGVQSVAPLVVIPYLTRILGPTGYGAIVFYQSLIAYGVVVLDFGFYVSAVRDTSRLRDDPVRLAARVKAVIATKCVLLLLVFSGMLLAVAAVPEVRSNWALFFACGLQLAGNVAFPIWLFQGLEISQKAIAPQIAARLITTALIFALVHSGSDLVSAAFLLSVSDLLCGVLAWKSVRQVVSLSASRLQWREVKRILLEDLPLFTISLGGNLYTAFNPLLIDVFYGHAQVAYYAISLRIATVVSKVTSPLIQSVSPRLAVLVIADVKQALRLLFRSGAILAAITLAFGLTTLLWSPLVLKLVAGPQFLGATAVLRVFSPVAFLMVLGSLVGQNFGVHLGLGGAIARAYWVIGAANLLLMIPATRVMGAVGSAETLVLAETLVVISLCVMVTRRLPQYRMSLGL